MNPEVSNAVMARKRVAGSCFNFLAVILSLFVANTGSTLGQAKPTPSPDLGKLADDYFGPLVADKRVHAAAVLFADKGGVIVSKTYGPIDLDRYGNRLAWGFYSRFLDAEFGTSAPPTTQTPELLRPKSGEREDSFRFTGLYRTVRYPHPELSKTFIILDLTRVTADRDGALRFEGASWIRTASLEFKREDGSETISFKEDEDGRIRFLGDTQEKIAWYESGYANNAFYFSFVVFFAVASWRARGALRWLSALALLHALGWLAVVLIRGPENLIFGLPWLLKGILWIGTATPLLTLAAVYVAWRKRTFLSIAALALYVPFVFYWNLRA